MKPYIYFLSFLKDLFKKKVLTFRSLKALLILFQYCSSKNCSLISFVIHDSRFNFNLYPCWIINGFPTMIFTFLRLDRNFTVKKKSPLADARLIFVLSFFYQLQCRFFSRMSILLNFTQTDENKR